MKYLISFLLMVIVISCNQNKKLEQPKPLLTKPQLIDVIVDIQILESYYANKYQRPEVFANALDSASFFIFKNHNISKPIFQYNLQYYVNLEGDSLFSVYEAALDTINNRINLNTVH